MKTRDLRQEDGRLTGFVVSNLLLTRYAIPRIVASIPGARILRTHKFFGPNRDDFCEFEAGGKTFLAIEPFGDNSEYWIVAEPPEESPQLSDVRSAFQQHRLLFGALPA